MNNLIETRRDIRRGLTGLLLNKVMGYQYNSDYYELSLENMDWTMVVRDAPVRNIEGRRGNTTNYVRERQREIASLTKFVVVIPNGTSPSAERFRNAMDILGNQKILVKIMTDKNTVVIYKDLLTAQQNSQSRTISKIIYREVGAIIEKLLPHYKIIRMEASDERV